jgi:hypothetical protein
MQNTFDKITIILWIVSLSIAGLSSVWPLFYDIWLIHRKKDTTCMRSCRRLQQVLAVSVDLVLVGSFVVVLCYRVESFSSQLENEWLDLACVWILQLLVGANVNPRLHRFIQLLTWFTDRSIFPGHREHIMGASRSRYSRRGYYDTILDIYDNVCHLTPHFGSVPLTGCRREYERYLYGIGFLVSTISQLLCLCKVIMLRQLNKQAGGSESNGYKSLLNQIGAMYLIAAVYNLGEGILLLVQFQNDLDIRIRQICIIVGYCHSLSCITLTETYEGDSYH